MTKHLLTLMYTDRDDMLVSYQRMKTYADEHTYCFSEDDLLPEDVDFQDLSGTKHIVDALHAKIDSFNLDPYGNDFFFFTTIPEVALGVSDKLPTVLIRNQNLFLPGSYRKVPCIRRYNSRVGVFEIIQDVLRKG